MTSVLPDLERDLVAAAHRQVVSAPIRPRRGVAAWLRGRSRPVQALLALLVISAAAASAATLVGTASAPLSGAVSANVRYRITLSPLVTAGLAGWCVQDRQTTTHGALVTGVSECRSQTAALGSPMLASLPGPTVAVITAPGVAAVRVVGGPTILTRADPSLPFGFRAAVYDAKLRLPDTSVPRTRLLVALDAQGRPIPAGPRVTSAFAALGDTPPPLPTHPWMRPGWRVQLSEYLGAFPHQAEPVPSTPPSGGCSTVATSGSGLQAEGGVDVTQVAPDPAIIGRAFLDCSDTLYNGTGAPMVISILLDAKHPGALPAALPGITRLPGYRGIFKLPDHGGFISRGDVVARRDGTAWLLASGPGTSAQHARALQQIKIRTVALHPPTISPAGPTGGVCSIGYRPLASLIETVQDPWHGAPPRWGPNPRLYPCTKATFYLDNWPLEAQIFAPINEPDTPHHPALNPVTGRPGIYTVATNGYTGPGIWQRHGRDWLVVTGGRNAQQELTLTQHLTANTRTS